jgi:NAD(P)-dependent dehydrogenase (short-subunit alcohol dehydrogenase family)
MEGLKQQAIARFNRVNIVINNAVTFYVKTLVDYTVEEWDRVIAVNLRAAFLTAKPSSISPMLRIVKRFLLWKAGCTYTALYNTQLYNALKCKPL